MSHSIPGLNFADLLIRISDSTQLACVTGDGRSRGLKPHRRRIENLADEFVYHAQDRLRYLLLMDATDELAVTAKVPGVAVTGSFLLATGILPTKQALPAPA